MENMEKESQFINWSKVSEELGYKPASISRTRIPNRHKEKITALLGKVSEWLKEVKS